MPLAARAQASGSSRSRSPKNNRVVFGDPLLGFGSSPEGPSTEPPPRDARFPTPSDARFHPAAHKQRLPWGFCPYSVFPARSSGLMVEPSLLNRLRLQVLTTSWRLLPPRACPALFHAGSALGVHPPELCSSRVATRRSRRRSPLDVLSVFRVLLHARVRHSAKRFRLRLSA